jgi:hypothetical protein
MAKTWSVKVVREYLVEAPTVELANQKSMAANIGQTADFEFGGMSIETRELGRDIVINGHRGEDSNPTAVKEFVDKLGEFSAKTAVGRYRRSVLKGYTASERDLIDWARKDGYDDDQIDCMVDEFLDQEWDWKAPSKPSVKAKPASTNALKSLKGADVKRTDRDTGKEHEYINFSSADGV